MTKHTAGNTGPVVVKHTEITYELLDALDIAWDAESKYGIAYAYGRLTEEVTQIIKRHSTETR